MKLALVVQRYGPDFSGGSEAHCRDLAQRLAERHEVTVLTSCARDYLTWHSEYAAGEQADDGVRVFRFEAAPRRPARLRELSDIVFSGAGTPQEEFAWFEENGPCMPGLLHHLETRGSGYDRVLFWAYRYHQSFFGLPLVAERSVLLPTAEEDPAIRMGVLETFFALPHGYLFLTPEEADLVGNRIAGELPPSEIIGTGLDPEVAADSPAALREIGVVPPYVLYLGRIDPNKGCDSLFRYFTAYANAKENPPQLVIAGQAAMPIPEHPSIKALGFVDAETRKALLSGARLLVAPSPYESLCIVVLEAWNLGRPVLVNGRCAVLLGQTRRADGGLHYANFDEFRDALDFLLDNPGVADQLGAQGKAYVESQYRWPTVMRKIESFLSRI